LHNISLGGADNDKEASDIWISLAGDTVSIQSIIISYNGCIGADNSRDVMKG